MDGPADEPVAKRARVSDVQADAPPGEAQEEGGTEPAAQSNPPEAGGGGEVKVVDKRLERQAYLAKQARRPSRSEAATPCWLACCPFGRVHAAPCRH